MENLKKLGRVSSNKQSGVQFGIWKQSIEQRMMDEMTMFIGFGLLSLINAKLLLMSIDTFIAHSSGYFDPVPLFTDRDYNIAIQAEELREYCPAAMENLERIGGYLRLKVILSSLMGVGSMGLLLQKIVVMWRIKNARVGSI
jgi:hypothetical protein